MTKTNKAKTICAAFCGAAVSFCALIPSETAAQTISWKVDPTAIRPSDLAPSASMLNAMRENRFSESSADVNPVFAQPHSGLVTLHQDDAYSPSSSSNMRSKTSLELHIPGGPNRVWVSTSHGVTVGFRVPFSKLNSLSCSLFCVAEMR